MSLAAFAHLRDFSEPKELPEDSFAEEEADNRLDPEEVARLIENAQRTAYEEGRAAGRIEGETQERSSISARLEGLVGELTGELEELRKREDELFAGLQNRCARLMLALMHKIARGAGEKEAQRLAQEVTTRALAAVRGRQTITIRAEESFLPALRAVLRMPSDEQAAEHRIVFEPVADDSSAPLEVAWLTGKVTFDPYAFTGEIDDLFTDTMERLTGGGMNLPSDGE
jgi:flagellar biosynthesis/type III secretory pathway protein FliH